MACIKGGLRHIWREAMACMEGGYGMYGGKLWEVRRGGIASMEWIYVQYDGQSCHSCRVDLPSAT